MERINTLGHLNSVSKKNSNRKLSNEQILKLRQKHFSKSFAIFYENNPIQFEHGNLQYLYDEQGNKYIDMYNNVQHLGHAHPRFVEAIAKQTSLLNVHTRYLHPNLVLLAEKLTSKLPPHLSICFFCNSGSEANDLAFRLATRYTKNTDIICLADAYHGTTIFCADVSTMKGDSKIPVPAYVHKVSVPDGYRGQFKRTDPQAGLKYAKEVQTVIDTINIQNRSLAAFIAEPVLGVGGMVDCVSGYLKKVYEIVHAAGGICISDEVQTGFGRTGTNFWGFENHGVVPDIVTMGKAIGNGFPLSAVITSPEIAASLDECEYFNTFGGNPVACIAGLTVLEVIEEEKLQQNAFEVGSYIIAGVKKLQEKYPLIGDVRGSGLYIGVEFVKDLNTLEPATTESRYIVDNLRKMGIVLAVGGPAKNVLRIKGPLCLTKENVNHFLQSLAIILEGLKKPRSIPTNVAFVARM
jgi:4-aminobutyrate aminotransferase-like enzyme